MPGSTGHGYPYAQPTDPLVQWPATSQSLAEAIDHDLSALADRFQVGATSAPGDLDFHTVTFPRAFTGSPAVITQVSGNDTHPVHVVLGNVTPTSFDYKTFKPDGTAISAATIINWFALG